MPAVIAVTTSSTPPPPVVSPWTNMDVTFTTAAGDTFDLASGDDGVLLVADGVRGLFMPPVDRNTQEYAGVAGSTWTGFRVKEREVFWPLFVYSDNSTEEFIARDRALWSGLRPDVTGVWSVVSGASESPRYLTVRYSGDGDPSASTDPTQRGWMLYALTLVAEDPYWRGDPITQYWSNASNNTPMFNSPGGLFIGTDQTIASASIFNPGDVDAYPIWTVIGPTTSVDVGVGGKVDQLHFNIPNGKAVILDTRPTVRTAFDANVTGTAQDGTPIVTPTGADLTGQLGNVAFAPIPPGSPTSLSLSMTGNGWVAATITPQYYRAW